MDNLEQLPASKNAANSENGIQPENQSGKNNVEKQEKTMAKVEKLISEAEKLKIIALITGKDLKKGSQQNQEQQPEQEQVEKLISETEKQKIAALITGKVMEKDLQQNQKLQPEQEQIEATTKEILKPEEVSEIQQLIAPDQHLDDEDDEDDDGHDFTTLDKLQLVETLEETVENSDIPQIKSKVAAIKVHFLKLNKEDIEKEMEQFILDGGDKDSYSHTDDPLETRFKAAFNKYKENKARFNELLEKQKQENLQAKNTILEELKELIASEETLKKTYDEFKILQDKWKQIGQVPAGEITNLWNNYHFLVEKFFDKVKINRELRDLDLKKNLEAKIELSEKAEELLLETSITKSFKLLQKYHDEWKEIGPVPQEKKDEIWERFKTATDKINTLRREHYAQIHEEQMGHYETKVALCEKAEELVSELPESVSAWQKKSNEINDLFKLWKSVGQAPKKINDEIWNRFKAAMDTFFEGKKSFFAVIKEQQLENYNRKLELCVEAESIKDSEDWRKTTNRLKQLQQEWKDIGPVPRRHSDKIWKRFRAACDSFFSRKAEHFSGMKANEEDNLKKKLELISRIEAFEVKKSRSENLDAAKAFQREWMEIGFVPIKKKDQLQQQYRKVVDKLFEKMKISEAELTAVEYRGMVENMKEDPDARDRIRRERNTLSAKISQLREEIQLWENNIGFFAQSKQADLMKAEYEKKINRAKNDLKILESKLKILVE